MDDHTSHEQAYRNDYDKGYADGVKKFAQKLKSRKYKSSDWSHGEHPFVVEESDIDEILKEMVGEEDA